MKRLRFTKKAIGLLLFSSLMLSSCQDIDEYYDAPDWIGGSIYQNLSDEGNYSIFLKGAELCQYQPILEGKSILTVMAPDDNAMKQYLQENYGTASIEDLPADELKKLIGYHILYYAYDKDKLINFRPLEGDGASDEDLYKNAGLYYKFRTRSQDAISTEFDKQRNRNISVYHNERLLPIFSYRMFQTKGINAKENYEYFYPETGWRGDGGFNVANAAVDEYGIIARNGYIYKVDRVIKPAETIYQYMKKSGKYQRFIDLYDKSEYYSYDSIASVELTNGADSLFHHYHKSPLVDIDSEWGSVIDYKEMAAMSELSYSVFAPTDEAFQNFFNEYWGEGGYTSIEEIDSVTMQEIMKNCVYSESIAFPDEIKNGKIENVSKEIVSFNTDEVPQADRVVCSNGVIYGCSVLTPPAKFRAVTGPAFQHKDYSLFNEMLNGSGMSSTLVADAVKYTMLYPNNQQLYNNAGIQRVDGVLVSTESPKGMNSNTMAAYINAHVSTPSDGNAVLPETGTKVLPTLIISDPKVYWYIKDGKITNSILHNRRLNYAQNPFSSADIWTTFTPLDYRGDINGWTNGRAYSYDNLLFPGNYSTQNNKSIVSLMLANRGDVNSDFYGWINLIFKAGLANSSAGTFSFMNESCMMFIPTTQAIENAIVNNKIPGVRAGSGAVVGDAAFFDNIEIDEDTETLEYYLKLYFIPLTTSTTTNYPYLGWGETTPKGLITLQQDQKRVNGNIIIETTNMNIDDDGTSLYVSIIDRETGVQGTKVKVSGKYDFFPFVFEDGVVHFIEDVF